MLKALLKEKQIYWDENLTALFEESKVVILNAIQEGIRTFKMGSWTCLMPDFCKSGIGYMLMQKKCSCEKITPYCCPSGWQLVMAGSRFTSGAESRYAPVEGEPLGLFITYITQIHPKTGRIALPVSGLSAQGLHYY